MKVLLISTSFPIKEDGSEAAGSFVKDFCQELDGQGHDVAVVYPVTEEPIGINEGSVNNFWFYVPVLPLSLLSPKKTKDWINIISTLSQGKKAVDNAVKEFKPDHIFALWALPSGHWARYAKKRYGVPYSIWALGSDIWSLGKVPVVKNYLKQVLQDATHLFADGYQLADDVTRISGKNCDFLSSTRQLPVCGLPLTKTKAPYRFCFLGRWHPNKGIDLLLQALHLLEDKDWERIEEVRIAGGGPMEKYVKEQVQQLQENQRPITLLGFQDKYGAAMLLTWADYVIIPSRIESIPVIFSDAMQAMRPVLAMPVGDLTRLLKFSGCGRLVTQINKTALAAEIVKVIGYFDVAIDELYLMNEKFNLSKIVDGFIRIVMKEKGS